MSLGGCFLETPSPLPFGASVVVYIPVPGQVDDAGSPVESVVTSTVRWTTAEGMGIQFGPTGARETAAILHLLGP